MSGQYNVGAVQHEGSFAGNQDYTADILTAHDWMRFDDHRVSKVSNPTTERAVRLRPEAKGSKQIVHCRNPLLLLYQLKSRKSSDEKPATQPRQKSEYKVSELVRYDSHASHTSTVSDENHFSDSRIASISIGS